MKGNILRMAGVLALAAAILAGGYAGGGRAAAAESIGEAQQKKEELQKSLKEAQDLIDQLEEDRGDIEKAVTQLDKKLTGISGQISDLEDQVEEKNREIKKTKKELKTAKKEEKSQYEGMRLRIRFMYENSGMSILEALLSSDSFADFLNRAEYFARIMSYDREMLSVYQDTRNQIENSEETLKRDREDLTDMKEQLKDEQAAVNLLLKEKESRLAKLDSGIDAAMSEAEQYEAKIAAENQVIAEIRAAEEQARKAAEEAARKAAEEQARKEDDEKEEEQEDSSEKDESEEPPKVNTDQSYTGGEFTWPCPGSQRITSGFGPRNSPTAGASSNHRGIDIGASYGSSIVAAADGVVTAAGYSSSLGNYVTVSHGGGLYTMYAHASSLVVSSGANVSRGQTIAKVGSTGISTGNHLHFAVLLNGQYVNPLNYL